MPKKLRYLILAVGVITFFVLAPLIVLYVRGLSFDTKTKSFLQTGLFAIRTEPSKVNIYLDGVLNRTSSGDIKFLQPREYTITIQKDGYFPWTKRLTILSDQVSWVSPSPNKLYLFLATNTPETLSTGVVDFHSNGNTVVSLASSTLSIITPGQTVTAQDYTLPKTARPTRLLQSPGGNEFMLIGSPLAGKKYGTVLQFNRSSETFHDISSLFAEFPALAYADNGSLFALSSSTLYKVDAEQKTKTPALAGVKAFTFLQNSIYYIKRAESGSGLFVSDLDGKNEQKLADNIPGFTAGQLFVTRQKHVFLLADGTLYKINEKPDKLSDNVSTANFDQHTDTLVFVHGGEVSSYNFLTQRVDFVTRSGEPVTNTILHQYTSVAFLSKGNTVEAIELDGRDRQNEYVFYRGANVQKLVVNDTAERAYVLDNGELKLLKIR